MYWRLKSSQQQICICGQKNNAGELTRLVNKMKSWQKASIKYFDVSLSKKFTHSAALNIKLHYLDNILPSQHLITLKNIAAAVESELFRTNPQHKTAERLR